MTRENPLVIRRIAIDSDRLSGSCVRSSASRDARISFDPVLGPSHMDFPGISVKQTIDYRIY